MVSSMGYVVLSGKIQLDRQDTTLVTPISWAVCSTLSLILMLSLCEGVRQCRYFKALRIKIDFSATVYNSTAVMDRSLSHQKVQVLPHV